MGNIAVNPPLERAFMGDVAPQPRSGSGNQPNDGKGGADPN